MHLRIHVIFQQFKVSKLLSVYITEFSKPYEQKKIYPAVCHLFWLGKWSYNENGSDERKDITVLPTVTGHKIHTLVLETPLLESCNVRSRHSASWAEILLGSFIEESDGEQLEQKGLGLLDFNSLLLLWFPFFLLARRNPKICDKLTGEQRC
jgi:hypothetical protein